jgi:glycosyltransferase involved in cell wall biosynthesis
MRIYFDLRCLQDPCYAFRGVGFHSAALLRHAKEHLPPSAHTIGILDEGMADPPAEYRGLVDQLQYAAFPSPPAGQPAVLVQLSPMTHDQSRLAPLLGRSQVFCATVIYDFIPLVEPQYLAAPAARRGYYSNLAWLKYYHAFYPISQYSADALRDVVRAAPGRVAVTGACLRETFVRFEAPPLDAAAPRCAFFPRHYFIVVGGQDGRKNVEAVLAAHARLLARRRGGAGLVVVGHYSPDYRDGLRKVYADHGGPPEMLEFVHDVTDQELGVLYHHALATVCPSRIEGFSLPVVEALACGSPVLASANDAHRELLPHADALFAHDDPARLAALLEELLQDHRRRDALLERQRGVAGRFAEDAVAARFWNHLVRAHRVWRAAAPQRPSKPRIAFLTPYPPDRSGVAEYTAHSLPSLARHATIDVFTDAKPAGRPSFVRRFQPISALPYVVDEYDRVVAVIGNSHFHIPIIESYRRHGGACLAHDNRMAELYAWWKGQDRFAEMATRALRRPVTVPEVQTWLSDPGRLPSIFFDELLPKADPLIVHSRGIQAQVAKEYGVTARYLPFCCYRHFTADELADGARREARERLGLPADRVSVITLGMVTQSKGCLECIWALEQLLAWGVPADLYFVGSSEHFRAPLVQLTERLGLTRHVHLTDDWISDRQYRDFLVAADFAIQLRTHCFGGLSGAVLDCISAGLPTVVNDDMARAMDGPEYVLRVPDHLSPTLIAEQIAEGHAAERHRVRCSAGRDDYVREHSFDNYAERMMQVLGLAG